MKDRAQGLQFIDAAVTAARDPVNPQLAHAFQLMSSAVYCDPTYGDAWYKCGCALSDQGVHHAAIATWRRALECQNDDIAKARILINLGWRLGDIGRIKEGLDH